MSKGYKAVAYNELCRLCAQSSTRRVDIFGEEGRLRQVAKTVQRLLCINISESDPLPKSICSFCLNRVEDFREFHANCLSASQFLHMKLPTVDEASGKCYVSLGMPRRPACLRRRVLRTLKAPIETVSSPNGGGPSDLANTNRPPDEEEVEVREYEECVQQPDDYNPDVLLKLLEDTMSNDCLLQDHDYLSIDELLGQDTPKKAPPGGKHIGKVMPVQDHDYLSSYDNPMTPGVTHQELLDHNYFTSLGPFADNFVHLLTPEEEGKFIEHNYFLPSAFPQEKPIAPPEPPVLIKEVEMPEPEPDVEEQCELCGAVFLFCRGHECSADFERQCEACGEIFMTNTDFSEHVCLAGSEIIEKQGSDVQCEVCGSVFDKHNHHNCLADFDRQCHKCGLVFNTLKVFEEHRCGGRHIKYCDFCNMKFKSKRKLERHIQGHIRAEYLSSRLTCNICGASYSRRAFYKQHMESHKIKQQIVVDDVVKNPKLFFEMTSQPSDSKPEYRCEQCSKTFSCNSNLLLHRRLHTRAYTKYKCEVCFQKFLKQTDYCKHVTSHLSGNTFVCDECPKAFESLKDLENHKIRHNANRKIKAVLNARKNLNVIQA